jgi:hypothetical protein
VYCNCSLSGSSLSFGDDDGSDGGIGFVDVASMIKSNNFELNVSYSFPGDNKNTVGLDDNREDVATIVVAVLALVAVLSFVAYVVSSASTYKVGVEGTYKSDEGEERDVEAGSAKDPEMGGLGQEVEMNELNPSAQKAYDGTIAVKHDGEVTL